MKRQLHTRSKNLQSTFIHFVEFQFTVKMLKQMSVSRIPDRLRLGVRGRVDVDCSRRDSEDSVDPDHVRGGSAESDCMAAPPQPCFSISHLSPSLLFPGIKVSCRHFPPKLNLPFLCIFYCSFFIHHRH